MIDPEIPGKILNGEPIEIEVHRHTDVPIKSFDLKTKDLETWLRQFNKDCGTPQHIYFSEKSNPQGEVVIEISIGSVPHGRRELLAGTLSTLGIEGCSPFEIVFRKKK